MFIGVIKFDLNINTPVSSLKDKRRIIKSMKDKLRNSFNISVSEIESQENYYRAGIGISIVSNDRRNLDVTINRVIKAMENNTTITIEKVETEIL